jgi:release factor glutamine methyltransferase
MDIAAGATVGALQAALPLDALENRILLCHALGLTRVGLITQGGRTDRLHRRQARIFRP